MTRNQAFPSPSLRAVMVQALILALVTPLLGADALAAQASAGYDDVAKLFKSDRKLRKEGMQAIIAAGDRSLAPWIVDALFFIPRDNRGEAFKALEALAPEDVDRSYWSWVEWVGRQQDLEPADGYARFKRDALMLIDKRFANIFYDGAPHHIRLEEIVPGGVKLDGIPSLDDPVVIPASQATYMAGDERVFGVALGGEARAYPLRMLDWHEMANDTVGGQPITLSYCTLCGSGVLYDTRAAGTPYRFGTSGLLYRSNKLMFDRQTWSLWSNLTGKAVVGRSAVAAASLPVLPMTLTTWDAWRRAHPQTTTLALTQPSNAATRFDYKPGLADRARAGVSFPVWQKSRVLDAKTEIYALAEGSVAKAYPLDRLVAQGVVNDQLGDRAIVLVADAGSSAVRAYERGARSFSAGTEAGTVVDAEGGVWEVEEDALVLAGSAAEPLPRVPGHVAYWFGWYGFYPHTEVWGSGGEARSDG